MERLTYELIESYEHCQRCGVYARDWEKSKLSPSQMLMSGIREGLTIDRKDYGQSAGERCYELAIQPGLDSKQYDIHSEVVHLCSLADVISMAIRKKDPWRPVEPMNIGSGFIWDSDAFLDASGAYLRRVICVSSWSDERHYGLCRSWGSLGTMCAYELPMKVAVVILGAHRDGRYHGPWSKGVMHPVNKKIRFRKKTEGKFKESWVPVWREDRDEIPTTTWLDAMLTDGVLQDSLLLIEIPLPERSIQKEMVELAKRKLEAIYRARTLPDKNLSTCDFPRRCDFLGPCHSSQEPSGRFGLVKIEQRG